MILIQTSPPFALPPFWRLMAFLSTTRGFMYEQVSMSKIRQRLSSKHQEIAERLTLMLTKSVKDQAQVKTT